MSLVIITHVMTFTVHNAGHAADIYCGGQMRDVITIFRKPSASNHARLFFLEASQGLDFSNRQNGKVAVE